jgi:hypothetical protein
LPVSAVEQPPDSEHRPHHNRQTIHGPDAPGVVQLSAVDMVALTKAILHTVMSDADWVP